MRPLKILVGLDSLLDTRLVCVGMINPDHVIPLLKRGYRERMHNKLSLILPEINDEAVETLFAERDMPMVKLSRSTNIVHLLAERIVESQISGDTRPDSREITIILNTYPYSISKQEVLAFANGLSEVFKTKKITRVHLPTEELTPKYLRENYSRYITHDLNEWLGVHQVNLIEDPMPLFTIISPKCILDPVKFTDIIDADNKGDKDHYNKCFDVVFESLKRNTSKYVELEFCPLADFSMTIPHSAVSKEKE
jgi:hypothetical protein